MASRRPGRWVLLAVMCVPLLAGCRSWQATPATPAALIADERPAEVRVTLVDESVVTIESPSIVSDTIRGLTASENVRAAIEDVRTLEVRRTSVPKSMALVVLHVAAVVSLIAIVVHVQPHYRGF